MTVKDPGTHPVSVRYLTRKLQSYGMKREPAHLAVNAVMKAIRETILEGRAVSLNKIGVFYFGFRIGRKMPEITTGRKRFRCDSYVQPDSYPLKFKPDYNFNLEVRQKFKHTKPLHIRRKKKHGNGFVHKALIAPVEPK